MFLRLARESLGRDQVVAQGALKEREVAIAQLVEPLRAALEHTEAQVQALERERRDAFSSLRTQIETLARGQTLLQRETRNLVTALRRPEVRGRWGELTLRRLVELAGLSEHCDFTEQLHVAGEDGAPATGPGGAHARRARSGGRRQDATRCLSGGARSATEEERAQTLRTARPAGGDARARASLQELLGAVRDAVPEFAVLFLPGDQFLSRRARRTPGAARERTHAERHSRHALDIGRAAEDGGLRLAPVSHGA